MFKLLEGKYCILDFNFKNNSMREDIDYYEVIKEYIMYLSDFDGTIKGRVVKSLNTNSELKYKWEVSHYYLPSKDAMGVYYPDNRMARDFESCKNVMFIYLNGFKNIKIVENKNY